MNKFVSHTGKSVEMFRPDIDTDQILPKQFLTRVDRAGFGKFLFHDERFLSGGDPNPEFVLNDPRNRNATIFIAGRNFGCGSSREHAPWALADFGFKALIAPSYGSIFYHNCLKIGLLPVVLDEADVADVARNTRVGVDFEITVDLINCTVSDNSGIEYSFQIDPFRRECLLNGLNDLDYSLQFLDEIDRYEARRPTWLPNIEI